MTALVLSIVLSTYLVVCFKFFGRAGVKNLYAIVFNYITCTLTGLLFLQRWTDIPEIIHQPWFPFAVFLGCSFFCIFNVMGFVARNIGVTVTSVASKLSMVIPVAAAVVIYHDSFTLLKGLALLLAFIAVFFTSLTPASGARYPALKTFFLALIIFLGSGLNDSLVNYISVKLISPFYFNSFILVIFASAAVAGTLTMVIQMIWKHNHVSLKDAAAGVLLGVPNYFSLLFLIKALHIPGWSSSVIFPVNNMGIVILSAVAAYFLFREKLSALNLFGIALALIAIVLMMFA